MPERKCDTCFYSGTYLPQTSSISKCDTSKRTLFPLQERQLWRRGSVHCAHTGKAVRELDTRMTPPGDGGAAGQACSWNTCGATEPLSPHTGIKPRFQRLCECKSFDLWPALELQELVVDFLNVHFRPQAVLVAIHSVYDAVVQAVYFLEKI